MDRHARLAALPAALLVAAAAVACISGGKKQAATVTAAPAAAGSPAASAVAGPTGTPVVLSPADKTVVAQGGNVALTAFTDPNKRFTASLPQGWKVENMTNGVIASAPSAAISATVSVTCFPGLSEAQLIQQGQNMGANVGIGAPDMTTAQPVTVAGVAAKLVAWQGSVGPKTVVHHVTVYFEGHGCAWAIQLNAFPPVNIQTMRPVLDGVLASFKFL